MARKSGYRCYGCPGETVPEFGFVFWLEARAENVCPQCAGKLDESVHELANIAFEIPNPAGRGFVLATTGEPAAAGRMRTKVPEAVTDPESLESEAWKNAVDQAGTKRLAAYQLSAYKGVYPWQISTPSSTEPIPAPTTEPQSDQQRTDGASNKPSTPV